MHESIDLMTGGYSHDPEIQQIINLHIHAHTINSCSSSYVN